MGIIKKKQPAHEHDRLLRSIAHNQRKLVRQGEHLMSLGSDILAAVTSTGEKIDKLIAAIPPASSVVSADEASAIATKNAENNAKLDAATPA